MLPRDSPREGRITFEGTEITGRSPAEILELGVSQVPQSDGLFANLTVRENVLMGAYIARRDRALPPAPGETGQPQQAPHDAHHQEGLGGAVDGALLIHRSPGPAQPQPPGLAQRQHHQPPPLRP